MILTLPWPPSVNTYWRNVNGRTILSAKGRAYRNNAHAAITQQGNPQLSASVRLKAHITAYPPDRRKRDLDNLPKAILDALMYADVIHDDGAIDDLRIVRGSVEAPGRVEVTLEAIA